MFAHTKMSFRICHFLCVHTREDTFTIVHMLRGVHVYLHTSRTHGTLLHSHAHITCHMSNTEGTHDGQMSGQRHFLICECSYNRYHRHTQTSLSNSHTPAGEYWCTYTPNSLTCTHNWWETRVHIHKTLCRPHTHAPDGGYWRTCPRKSTRCAL